MATLSHRARRTAATRSDDHAGEATGSGAPCMWVAWSATTVEVRMVLLDVEFEVDEIGEGVREPVRTELITHPSTFALGPHQATALQWIHLRLTCSSLVRSESTS